MTQLRIKQRSDKPKKAGAKGPSITTRTVTSDDGRITVRSIDANSRTFADDLLYVFTKNVESARKENRERLGSASGIKQR